MSYILEALKKAQAERQLGEVPSVHAPSMQVGADTPAGGKLKKPMVAAMALMAGVIVALLALVWRKGEAPVAAPVSQSASAPAAASNTATQPATVPSSAAQLAAAQSGIAQLGIAPSTATQLAAISPVATQPGIALPATAQAAGAPAAMPAGAQSAAPVVVAAAPSAQQAVAPARAAPALVAAAGAPVVAGSPSGVSARASASAAGTSSGEEVTQTARDLPEPIQRSLPPIVVGGYIYSKDPADRLLLIDKVLRHEGEEVAPGLVLEKLLPKSAVFSFKGYRYRVPY